MEKRSNHARLANIVRNLQTSTTNAAIEYLVKIKNEEVTDDHLVDLGDTLHDMKTAIETALNLITEIQKK